MSKKLILKARKTRVVQSRNQAKHSMLSWHKLWTPATQIGFNKMQDFKALKLIKLINNKCHKNA